ncbi:5-formyltetrahydrofolate cyclo-ligase [Candidatus Bathyarchaeota archaeon]|nr:5-formyltetrahydrofolate cyclo-ligase [Candidatus Bathyarchaeota archaeon]
MFLNSGRYDVKKAKEKLRLLVWRRLEEANATLPPKPCYGRIPNFKGAYDAALKASKLPEWENAKVVFVNPDSPQRHLRLIALKQGKLLIMATPKLKSGFLEIDPLKVRGVEDEASTIGGAFKYGKLRETVMYKPGLIVTGCVAVDREFNRLGKGGGYGDKEISLIKDKYGSDICVLTTIHDLQVVDSIPIEPHDSKVDIVVTPSRILRRRLP